MVGFFRGRTPFHQEPRYSPCPERNFVSRLGTIRLRFGRPRQNIFLLVGAKRFQRLTQQDLLIWRFCDDREGRTGGGHDHRTVSAQTVSKLTPSQDEAVCRSHRRDER